MSARSNRLAPQKEGWYAVHPLDASPILFGTDLLRTEVAVKQAVHVGRVEAALPPDTLEHVAFPDVFTVDEIGVEQALNKRVLQAVTSGEPDQSVGIEGVRHPPDSVEVEIDSFFGARRGNARFELPRARQAAELANPMFLPVNTRLGNIGIQFERP